jgi:ABC transporter substrate binding protein (PQQ-dependent alcohol dehydrogenase system)
MDRGAHDRRGGVAREFRESKIVARLSQGAAFKGQRLTLRDWNLQLRQPILLADGRMVVSVSPQEGFLHQVSELDTLGVDRPETKCKLH